MKKRITCHYRNGSLLFSTMDGYTRGEAYHILEIFMRQNLDSWLQPTENHLFKIKGRLNIHYDPFIASKIKWNDVILIMSRTLGLLEASFESWPPATNSGKGYYIQRK